MAGIARITGLRLTVDLKTISDSGMFEITDSALGVWVDFNETFADVKSLLVKSFYNPSFPVEAFADWQDVPNPTGFRVFARRTDNGDPATARGSWEAEGY